MALVGRSQSASILGGCPFFKGVFFFKPPSPTAKPTETRSKMGRRKRKENARRNHLPDARPPTPAAWAFRAPPSRPEARKMFCQEHPACNALRTAVRGAWIAATSLRPAFGAARRAPYCCSGGPSRADMAGDFTWMHCTTRTCMDTTRPMRRIRSLFRQCPFLHRPANRRQSRGLFGHCPVAPKKRAVAPECPPTDPSRVRFCYGGLLPLYSQALARAVPHMSSPTTPPRISHLPSRSSPQVCKAG
jgi:hypothetical protein